MNINLRVLLVALVLSISSIARSQVLITLLFGEALNTPKIEFGLVGGMNRSYLLDIDQSKGANFFNLGFYFHINLQNNSYLSTGVLVKSNTGANGMNTYPIGNQSLDSIFADGTLSKKIGYFYVPIMYQYRFATRWYAEAGFQVGLRSKATDNFTESTLGGDLEFTIENRDDYKHVDGGLIGGIGFKLDKEPKGPAVGINYYYGLVNISETGGTLKNSTIYFYGKIPIGVAPKEKAPID